MLADLSRTPFAEPLRRLSDERRSGDLEVRSGRIVKTLFFDHGRIVFAASNLRKDRLGDSLMELGRITPADYERAQRMMQEDGHRQRFGDALVKAGLMDAAELGHAVARQVDRIALSLFRYGDGVATFEDRRCTIPLDYMVSLSTHRLLYEGIRTMRSQELVMAGLGNLDRRVTLARLPPFAFEVEDCTALELDLLEQAQRRVTVRKLAWVGRALDFRRLRAAYALLASGVLTEQEVPPEARAPVIQMETGTFLLSALPRRLRLSTPRAVLQEVRDELVRSARLDREEWLRVSANAPREELVRALEAKMERYHQLVETAGADSRLRTDVETILGRAWSLMRALLQKPAAEATQPLPKAALKPPSEAERLRREADLRLAVQDYASAAEVLTRLVRIEPHAAAHHAALAGALAKYPPQAAEAERAYHEALRLAPDDVELHYQLGLYYRDMKQRSRAIGQLQTAVRLDARHAAAREALEALSPDDDALTTLKRLLRER